MQLKFRLDSKLNHPGTVGGAQVMLDTLKFYPVSEEAEIISTPEGVSVPSPTNPNIINKLPAPDPRYTPRSGIVELTFTDGPDLSAFVVGRVYTLVIDSGE